jgi:hypothetical protein
VPGPGVRAPAAGGEAALVLVRVLPGIRLAGGRLTAGLLEQTPGLALDELRPQPVLGDPQHGAGLAARAHLAVQLELVQAALPARVAAVGQVVHVRRPVVQAVEDVSRVTKIRGR